MPAPVRRPFVVMALLLSWSLPTVVAAQDATPRRWEATAEAGYVVTSGNSQVTSTNLGTKAKWQAAGWGLSQEFALIHGETGDSVTASLARLSVKGQRTLLPRLSAVVTLGWDRNRFAGIQRRYEQAVGLEQKLIEAAHDLLTLTAGVAAVQQRSTVGRQDDFLSATALARYRHTFAAKTWFEQSVEVLPNLDVGEDLRVNAESALVAALNSRLAMKVGYVVRYDGLPEPGFRTTDRVLTTGLQVAF